MKKIYLKIIIATVILIVAIAGFILTKNLAVAHTADKTKTSTEELYTNTIDLVLMDEIGEMFSKQIKAAKEESLIDLLKRYDDKCVINQQLISKYSLNKNNNTGVFTIQSSDNKEIKIYVDNQLIDDLQIKIESSVKTIELREVKLHD